jgi:GTPase SAR1 family protein
MAAFDRVRILVLGDSGVGKTSLVHLMSQGQPLRQISYTIGATVEVKLHEYREGTPAQKTFWIGESSMKGLMTKYLMKQQLLCGKNDLLER